MFEHLRHCIEIEIDEPELGSNWRELVVAARKEAEGEEIPAPDCEDVGEWDIEVQEISDGILWDADYDDEHLYADRYPEEAKELRRMTCISEDYFQYIPEDIKDEEIQSRIRKIRKVCRPFVKE